MWGPQAFTPILYEDYVEGPDGQRMVWYFDKARMEVTFPDGDPFGEWYVTNGLLVTELVTGRKQLGDTEFRQLEPAQVNVAGDPADLTAPTYASFTGLLDATAGHAEMAITRVIQRDGSISGDPELADYAVGTSHFVSETQHWIADPFWTFMTSEGLVYEAGAFIEDDLFPNPYYATGYPIVDSFWANVTVGGVHQAVLVQCFERRCLTYTPGNPDGWQIEAGNVGQHYYTWRYGGLPTGS